MYQHRERNNSFYVIDRGWVAAGDINEGDEVYLIDGSTAFVTRAELEKLEEPIKVYNLEVADFNTYFVGDEAVLVHNYPGSDDVTDSELTEIYDSIKQSPNYPEGFKAAKNGTTKNNIKNEALHQKLKKIEAGKWYKVYKDGFDSLMNEISIHFFQSPSGKVFDVKVKSGWSNSSSWW